MGAGFVEVGIDCLLFRLQRCILSLDLFDRGELCKPLVVEKLLGGAMEGEISFVRSQELLGVTCFLIGHIRIPRFDVIQYLRAHGGEICHAFFYCLQLVGQLKAPITLDTTTLPSSVSSFVGVCVESVVFERTILSNANSLTLI